MIARPVHRPQPIPFSAQREPSYLPIRPMVARRSPVTVKLQQSDSDIPAKYLGQGALSVQSTVTGRLYRFQGHGCTVAVAREDVLMLRRLPDLLVG